MTDRQFYIARILHAHISGKSLSEEEKKDLDRWRAEHPDNALLFEKLSTNEILETEIQQYLLSKQNTWDRIKAGITTESSTPRRSIKQWRNIAAALILVLSGVLVYWLVNRSPEKNASPTTDPVATTTDITAPSGTHATLVVGNKTIILDNAVTGSIATKGSITINKGEDGSIRYTGTGEEVEMNLLSVPRGGLPVPIHLADGSQIWVNAASSISYPTAFIGKERRVEITGEVFFEITHDPSKPFIVQKRNSPAEVKVLGTKFNMNTYDNESSIDVSLLQGSVRVSAGAEAKTLKPGQQAKIANTIRVIDDVDMEAVTAWKDGFFNFKGANIKDIMRQVERWYDAEVSFEGNMSGIDLYAIVSRRKNVSELLHVLEKTGVVHFKIEGKKIIVSK